MADATIKKVERILTSEYSTQNFLSLVQEIFATFKIIAPNSFRKEFTNFSSHIEGSTHIGDYVTDDNEKIAVFSVQLKKDAFVERSRSTQRNYAKKLIESGNCEAALVAFYTDDNPKWRLSFVRLDYQMRIEKGSLKAVENLTPAKRYSYLVGKDEPCHTAIDHLRCFIVDSNSKPSLSDIEEAFSVEKVTKEFFDLYREKYLQLREHLDDNADFVAESQKCGFSSEQFAKKLMGQIVFLYFLQKKGWLGVHAWKSILTEKEYKNVFFVSGAQGRIIKEYLPKVYTLQADGTYKLNSRALDEIPDDAEELIANNVKSEETWGDGSRRFLRTLFNYSQTHKKHFYEEYLEPLFYDTLNRNRGVWGYCPALHCRIPFLSGGLFEPLDGYDWKSNYFDIPDEMFSNKKDEYDLDADGILDIFDRYNFTMSEDEPMEREVAIDPEMLGKVFENLLEVKDRKSSGSFYTPREIVHYMCRESLINYLTKKTDISETAIRDFIIYGDFMKDEDTDQRKRELNDGLYISEEIFKMDIASNTVTFSRIKEIDDALASVKIADPAVGSGAFPLGMINEIVRARENISAYMSISMNKQARWFMYSNDRSPYALKIHTIKNSIFAVDIEPSAVDITQLRLWLSIVIDDEINPKATNELDGHKNPLPLPNLECNILCGNSLIDEFEGIKLINESDLIGTSKANSQIDLNQNAFEAILKKMLEKQDELFRCDDTLKKEELKKSIQGYKDSIIEGQLLLSSNEIKEKYQIAIKQSSLPFVLWQLDFARVFKENGGFDIVIGNPPYVSTKKVSNEDKKIYERVFGFSDDTYNMFTFRGMSILKNGGSLSYIIPKTFWTTQTKRNMRDLLLQNTIAYIFDTANPFESAMVDTCIIHVIKTPFTEDHTLSFMDGSQDLSKPVKMFVKQSAFINTQNSVIFKPTEFNLRINEKYGKTVKELYDKWWDKIKTSKDIEKNKKELAQYRDGLKPGDIALLGCLTEGGQGLATANNGKYIAVRKSTKWANNIMASRPAKLLMAIEENNIPIGKLSPYSSVEDFFANADECKIAELFDSLKEEYGRDIFGQGYIYRLIDDSELADVDSLTRDEKENGIDTTKCYYVPYDKGDKDGNRWYLETPFAIAWSKENVRFLKTDPKARYQGYSFYFREGFCWSDINTTYLKCRIKGKSVNDVKSMSLYGMTSKAPECYIVALINSAMFSFYVDSFVNNTQTFQINDARQLPIKIPNDKELAKITSLFDEAVQLKKDYFANLISLEKSDEALKAIQEKLDSAVLDIYAI
ncbi:MAG: Eco57I restriction-modification methylase domain-containing protein [Firmicutes bacterium]|nr:Eco57I restriction-modification methylase domain-containing protein [Bacillota bacterium]